MAVSSVSAANWNDSLVLFMPFDANVSDLSGNDNHGMFNGSATIDNLEYQNGNGSLYLDGIGSFVQINDSDTIDFNNTDYSYKVTVKFTSLDAYDGILCRTVAETHIPEYCDPGLFARSSDGGEWRFGSSDYRTDVNPPEDINLNQYYDVVVVFNDTSNNLTFYLDGDEVFSSTSATGAVLAYTQPILIGNTRADELMTGYVDEVVMWRRALTPAEVSQVSNQSFASLAGYDETEGTQPVDLAVCAPPQYTLPIDWSYETNGTLNSLPIDVVPFNVTLCNVGEEDAESVPYNISIDGVTMESGVIQLNASSNETISFNWTPTTYGFSRLSINLDTNDSQFNETNENNNNYGAYLPYIEGLSFTLGNRSDYADTCVSTVSSVDSIACSSFHTGFTSDDFDSGWTAYTSGVRAKKGFENAAACVANGYNNSHGNCQRGMRHLIGWATVQGFDATNLAQEVKEMGFIGQVYDVLLPMTNQTPANDAATGYQNISKEIMLAYDIHTENQTAQKGDNGKGFMSHVTSLCFASLGKGDNPTNFYIDNDNNVFSVCDEFIERENRFLSARKDDAYSTYQENFFYKVYAEQGILHSLLWRTYWDIDVASYQNAIDAMSREVVYQLVSNTSNSSASGDEWSVWQSISAGDGNSFEAFAENDAVGGAIYSFYAYVTGIQEVKDTLLEMRITLTDNYKNNWERRSPYDLFLHRVHYNNATPQTTGLDTVVFDNANDIFMVRPTFTYNSDLIFRVDGGEERGEGHSQAQGVFLSYNGFQFLDYEQVPYDDDTRGSPWKNGISLANTSTLTEGTNSQYKSTCGDYGEGFQYYGMGSCDDLLANETDSRQFPLQYGGDVENYMGTADAHYASVFVWRPYKNADPVEETYVKYGDYIVKRTKVSGNTNGNGVYQNVINKENFFDFTISGNNLTINNSVNHLGIYTIWSNETVIFTGGVTNVQYCFAKTDCSGNNRGNSTYARHYQYTTADNIDMITAFVPYTGSGVVPIPSSSCGSDEGVVHNNSITCFDTNEDGTITSGSNSADGHFLLTDNTNKVVASTNVTSINYDGYDLLQSNETVEFWANVSSNQTLEVRLNTMKRSVGIDYPQIVRVTLATGYLANNSNYSLTTDTASVALYSYNSTHVTFNVDLSQAQGQTGGQTYYLSAGDTGNESMEADETAPTLNAIGPTNSTYGSSSVSHEVSCSDNVGCDTIWYNIGGSNITYSGAFSRTGLTNGSYFVTYYANDTSGNEATPSTIFYSISIEPEGGSVAGTLNIGTNVCSAFEIAFSNFSLFIGIIILVSIGGVVLGVQREKLDLSSLQVLAIAVISMSVTVAVTLMILGQFCGGG